MLEKFKETKDNIVASYYRYWRYYDVKALEQPLPLHSFCLLLNPLLTNQSDSRNNSLQVWIPLYRVEKVLTNSNYIIRKVGTNYTQCVHRIRTHDETHDEAPATIRLSIPIGGPPAPMVALLPPPLPPPVVPRVPLPDPVLEQPAIPLIERNDDPDRNEPIVNAPVGDQNKVVRTRWKWI